ncbi:transposase [Massilimicrobiota sp. SW1139]|uniref:transposase n=1 Tax=Massilimicrobiota sp. SW1139 TaxID=2530043 RepID=UPI00143BAD1B|nr:transposase [Massilimicrobiota sp. SW1139]
MWREYHYLKINLHYINRTDIFRYLWHGDNNFTENELKQINNRYNIIKELNHLIKDFRKLFADKSIIELCLFITNNKDSAYSQIRSFIKSVLKDIEPISNAVVKEYDNGFVEGTNNKLKMIKRQSYGGCKLELLRAQFILQSLLSS